MPVEASDQVVRLPQPVPLDLLPISVGSSPSVPGAQWSGPGFAFNATPPASPSSAKKGDTTKSTIGSNGATTARTASQSSLRSHNSSQRGRASPGPSFIDTGSSDEDNEAARAAWPSPRTGANSEPPVIAAAAAGPAKKPSLLKRALSGTWRKKLGLKSRGILGSFRKRLNSKSPKDLIPKSWGEYRRAYAAREIDVDDPPPPPSKPTVSQGIENEQDPYESKAFFAPRPRNEVLRQNILNRLDVLGRGRRPASPAKAASPAVPAATAPSAPATTEYEPGQIRDEDVCVPTPPEEMGPSLKAHPAFKRIVAFARQTFDAKLSMLSILDNDQQIFLAESGLGGMEGIPRDIGFCAHTLLSSTKGLVILDTHKDWRYANTPLVTDYGSRFYAGVPLLAPRGTGYADGRSLPIGTLCIVDDKPRESFSELDRRRLVGLANYARSEIEAWSRARTDVKLAAMNTSYEGLRSAVASCKPERLEALFEAKTPELPAAGDSLPPTTRRVDESVPVAISPTLSTLTPPLPITPANGHTQSTASTAASLASGADALSADDETTMSSAATSISPANRTYAMAVRLVAETLRFDLVYLVRVTVSAATADLDAAKVSLIAAYGLPNTTAAHFDPSLHVKALRAPERGLLYQNPRTDELRSGERFPAREYASALLVPVAEGKDSGFVMAAYTTEPSRVFGAEDLLYMQSIAAELHLFLKEEL